MNALLYYSQVSRGDVLKQLVSAIQNPLTWRDKEELVDEIGLSSYIP
jgi:hypothetical protein